MIETTRLLIPSGREIAYRYIAGDGPTVLFLTGFGSDMLSDKATALQQWCIEKNEAFACFDYSGHGQSSGEFTDFGIGDWLEDTLYLFDHIPGGQKILVGSSMGGWIALLLALRRKEQIAGVITLACAADFISDILLPNLDEASWQTLEQQGTIEVPSEEEASPYMISRRLLDNPEAFDVLKAPIDLHCPIDLIHGLKDRHIPWQTSLRVLEQITGNQARLTLINSATHRLSRQEDIVTTQNLLEAMLKQQDNSE